jgi:S-adenosylmethionine hydrolase
VSGPLVTFLSDYGVQDEFVGVCHGVIAGICPEARIIDITHGVPRHDVRVGAVLLRGALAYMPKGVHVAVVDPDVGAARRAVALGLADDRVLVGPDNGLLSPTAAAHGGVIEAVEISASRFRLQRVSATFHGRDIFAPVAAHLAAGVPLADVGEPCDPDLLVALELPHAQRGVSELRVEVIYVDRFGNAQLSATHEDLDEVGFRLGHGVTLELAPGATFAARYVRTFADAGPEELIVYEDAGGSLAVAVSHGDAAHRLGLRSQSRLRISLT